jgi:hypothetical protein
MTGTWHFNIVTSVGGDATLFPGLLGAEGFSIVTPLSLQFLLRLLKEALEEGFAMGSPFRAL